jgi:hypothetical protein
MRWLVAAALIVLLSLPTAAQAQVCGSGAPYWYIAAGWFPTGAYGSTGCYWLPASSNAPLQPQLYPSQQQPTTTSLAGVGNAGAAGWYLYPPGLGPSLAGPASPSGYASGGSSVVPGSLYPTVAGAPISPWQYPSFVQNELWGAWLRYAPYPTAVVDGGSPGPAPALGALAGSGVAPPAPAASRSSSDAAVPDGPPIPGRGGGNYVGDDPTQRGTITIVRPGQ